MDGLPENLSPVAVITCQRTLKSSICCVGIGLHSGANVRLSLHAAAPNTGIIFRRTDLNIDIPGRFDLVSDTRLCTMLAHPDHPQARVGTVEHLMAAFAAAGIDNAIVEIDGPELPVLDGSADPYLFLIDCAGRLDQAAPRRVVEVLRTIRVESGEGFAELRPSTSGLTLSVSIDFSAAAIGRQALTLPLTEDSFRAELATARTFTLAAEINAMRNAGLARGGSLQNAIVVDGATILNPEGLRSPDEFVRHKMLDAVGDLALAGATLQARFIAHRPGHALNNQLLRTLFADTSAWRYASPAAAMSLSLAARAA
jgi:UDP-3-O-[3-hydroxymyristoyl] N-acetylglucosamine deacetylase